MSINGTMASSLSQYVEVCKSVGEKWSDSIHGEVRPWYRGHGDANWSLRPTEYRYVDLDSDEMISEFQLKARPLLQQSPQSDWEWYFLMRHHGLPTRLLDWTTGALLGLYFALRDSQAERDAAVWMLDPWALNKRALRKRELILSSEKAAISYLPKLFARNKRLPRLPIAIVPPFNSTRITAQRGTFTVHGSDQRGLDRLLRKELVKIEIPKEAIVPMRRDLWACGIGEFTVFPELDGLCREILAAETG